MKNILIIVITIFSLQMVTAQAQVTLSQDKIYQIEEVDVKPSFVGGLNNFAAFMAKNFATPAVEGLKGDIVLTFVIEKDGSLSDIKVLKDVRYGTGKEAMRVMKLSPNWTPAEQNGQKVRCAISLPIKIQSGQ